MTFNQVCYQNFKYNVKQYIAYFFCTLFTSFIFFIYSACMLNKSILNQIKKLGNDAAFINGLVITSLVIIWIFSLFFISYSHSSFIKTRSQEFALYLSLGMSRRNIANIVFYEIMVTILLAIIVGLSFGTIFSKLFFLQISKILNFSGMDFNIGFNSYLLSIVAFFTIMTIVIITSYISIFKLQISELFKYSSQGSIHDNKSFSSTMLGIIIIFISLLAFFISTEPQVFMFSILASIAGIFLTLSKIENLIIKLIKKNKNVFYKNLLSIAEISHQFKQYRKIIFISTVLSALVIYFIGLAYSFYKQSYIEVDSIHPFDLVFLYNETSNDKVEEKINKIAEKYDTVFASKKTTELILLDLQNQINSNNDILIFSEYGYNSISSDKVSIEDSHYITITQRSIPENYPWNNGIIKLNSSNKTYSLDFKYELWKIVINKSSILNRFLVISDNDYKRIRNEVNKNRVFNCFIANFIDNENNSIFLNEIKGIVQITTIISKQESYIYEISKNKFILFIMCFIGILFFVSIGFVLYFKMFTDISGAKDKYRKIQGIGIESVQIARNIALELKILFFTPVVFGSIIGLLYILIQTTKSMGFQKEILFNSIIVIILYTILQIAYYFIAKNKYLIEVNK